MGKKDSAAANSSEQSQVEKESQPSTEAAETAVSFGDVSSGASNNEPATSAATEGDTPIGTSVESAAPEATDSVEAEAETETSEESEVASAGGLVKRGFARVRIPEFRGSFEDAVFDDNGVCERINEATFASLIRQFPGAQVAEFVEVE